MSLNEQAFAALMRGIKVDKALAVGVSGGPDSMALCWLLCQWGAVHNIAIHAITVDHGLRDESAREAQDVGASIEAWPQMHHVILQWNEEKPKTRILEEARFARYDLIRNYMQEHGIRHLFTAHHLDDQAETFLLRLAKGSGLDGLTAMQSQSALPGGMVLCRPLLMIPKADLIALCQDQVIAYAKDPSNENEKYLRPRLRAARAVLEEEGLTSKRLGVTAARLFRAREALDTITDQVYKTAIRSARGDQLVLSWDRLRQSPDEIILRILIRSIDILCPEDDYNPRMERMESLMDRILHEPGFKKATLGGCLFSLSSKDETLTIEKEKL